MEASGVLAAARPGVIRPWIVDAFELLQAAVKRLEAMLALQKGAVAILEDAVKFHPDCEHCRQALATMAKLRAEVKRLG